MSALTTGAVLLAANGEPSPLKPHTAELIIGLVAFALLFFFLRAKVFPVFERTYAARAEAIEGGIARAEAAQAEAQTALELYRSQLAEARHEAAQLREDARQQGATIVAEMRTSAQEEAERITRAAREQIESDRRAAMLSLRTEVGSLAIQLAGRIVGESLEDEARQRRVVERFLADLESGQQQSGQQLAGQER